MKVTGQSHETSEEPLARRIASLFPPGVATAHQRSDQPAPALFPVEMLAVQRAVASRQHEFALGRSCARAALAGLGIGPCAIPVGVHGAPVWPVGTVGSISHCRGLVIAAAARTTNRIGGIGIDTERAMPLDDELVATVCAPPELAWMAIAPPPPTLTDWPKILFSAKESIHKCLAPLHGETFEFDDITVQIFAAEGSFSATAARPLAEEVQQSLRLLSGKFLLEGEFLITGALIESPPLLAH